ncbi:type II secretion system secretin GspD [bacterium]|nr:type II secretion system secretin GspD [bacterium]
MFGTDIALLYSVVKREIKKGKNIALAWTLVLSLVLPPAGFARTNLPKKGGKVTLDFHDVALKDVVTAISEITGKNIILDPKASAKITIISPNAVSIEEAYDAFLTVLDQNNLTATDQGQFTVIEKRSNTQSGEIITEDDYSAGGKLITRVVKLKYVDATMLREALRSKVSLKGKMIAYGPTNSLFITDSAASVRSIEKMIQLMDKENFKMSTEVVPLKHAQADDIAEKLKVIIDSQAGGRRSKSKLNNIAGQGDIVSILPDNRTNSLLVTSTRKGLEDILDLLVDLDRKASDGNLASRVKIKKLKHADAEELASLLSGLFNGSGGASVRKTSSSSSSGSSQSSASKAPVISSTSGGIFEGEVKVGADPSTNSLIITASPNDYLSIEPVIDQLDQRRSQVFVEALIMEVTMTNGFNVGVGLGGSGGANGLGGAISSNDPGAVGSPLLVGVEPAKMFGALAGLPGLAGSIVGGSMKLPGTNLNLPISAATFRAMQSNGYVNVISSPNILTTDNKKASIEVGKTLQIPKSITIATAGALPQQSFESENVGLKLAVTPQINDMNSVTLDLEQVIEDVGEYNAETQSYPRDTRTLTTTVVAQNQQTIALGGLIKDREKNSTGKVPLLGDIPLVGALFKQKVKSSEKVNLILFLTPHIIRDPMDLTRISVKKNNERRRFNKKNKIGENQALYDYDLDKGLNMAPQPDRDESSAKPTRRFDYENFNLDQNSQQGNSTIDNASTESSNNGDVSRRRESYRPQNYQPLNDTEVSAAPRPKIVNPGYSVEDNPFADVQPPSSSTN